MNPRGIHPMTFAQRVGRTILGLFGWRVAIETPPPEKCVVVGAHHTSSADFFLTLAFILASGVSLRWLGKDTLFRGLLGGVMRRLGGLPVNRRVRSNLVRQMVDLFASHKELRVAISPEGTRSHASRWWTGFYYMALGARVPIVLGYADFARRVVGLGPVIHPTGNLTADLARIRAFYTNITGRHPEKQGEIRVETIEGEHDE